MSTLREAATMALDALNKVAGAMPFPVAENARKALQAALAEQPIREAPGNEHERLRALQAAAVMPLIGPLLDAWEGCSQDVRGEHPELDKQLRKINRAMTDAGDVPGTSEALAEQPAAPADSHKEHK